MSQQLPCGLFGLLLHDVLADGVAATFLRRADFADIVEFDEVPAELGADGTADLAFFQFLHRAFKFGHHHAVAEPAQIAALRRTKETVLPVVNEDRRFVGLVSSLRLAELTQEDGSLDAPLSDLPLIDEAVAASAPPSEVLGALRRTGLQSLPVVDPNRRVVGWVSERNLVDRMYRDQRRAIEARTQTSWGSRMQERRKTH